MSHDAQDNPLSVSGMPPEEEGQFSAPAPEIEGYRILDKLGEAGQGQVWRAVQLSTQRQVALKVPRIGLLSSKKTLARFEREVEMAARLRHPHIAQIFDSGVHHGLYYFAMDLVEGTHLDQYVKDRGLSQREILDLMKLICEAVQHAHQNGVIHRDLKPSNIIVTADGRPYIVDFGLAKSLVDPEAAATVSADGEAAGTPAYMSPEQATGHGDQVDTRTDVYSLGAILFTLLTGQHPHDLSGSHLEVLRRITEGEVIQPRKLCPSMDRDLEALLLKALEHDPDRRYSSAAGLAEDIDHYLHGLPLSATPQSRIHRINSFIRRHRVGVAIGLLTSGMGLVSVIILAVSTIMISQEKHRTQNALEREQEALSQETQARTESERQAKIAQAVTDFLTHGLLASVDPAQARGRQVTVREVLDAASKKVPGWFRDEPLTEAAVRGTLGDTYAALGEYAQAAPHLERVRQLYQEHASEDNPSTIQSMESLGWLYINLHRLQEAEVLLLKSLEISKRALGEAHMLTLGAMHSLAVLYKEQGRYDEAEALNIKVIEVRKRILGGSHLNTLNAMHNLASLYADRGRYQEAEKLLREVLEIKLRWFGEDHPDTLRSMSNLAAFLNGQRRYSEAEPLFVTTIETMKRVMGNDHPVTLRTTCNLADSYAVQGRYQEAESLLIKTMEIAKRTLGEDHADTLGFADNLAHLYLHQGRYQEAELLCLKTVETQERLLGAQHRDTVETMNLLVTVYKVWGKPEEARKWRAKLPGFEAGPIVASEPRLPIPEESLRIPEELQACAANLHEIYAAIQRYQTDKGMPPDWLSDLAGEYLRSETLFCPNDPNHTSEYSPDPKLPCSYSWELSSSPVPTGWDPTGRTLYRDWKRQQAKLFGNVVPMVRCTHHGDAGVLSLSVGGQVYLGPLDWEYVFKKDYRFGVEQSSSPSQPAVAESALPREVQSQPPPVARMPERKQLVAAGWKASWSPDGTHLVYGRPKTGGLQILDIESGQTTDVTTSGRGPAWSPDGRFIAYVERADPNSAETVEVWLTTSAGESPRKLMDGGYPTWSADGKTLFVESPKENKIFSVDVDDPEAGPKVFYDSPQSWYPAVSSDGKRIAFGRRDELVIIDRETGQMVLTWPTPGRRGLLPAWSPDGRQIAYGGFDKDPFGVWVLDLKTQEAVQVATGPFTMPAWSNDGTRLAFDLRSESEREIWVVQTKDIQGPKVNAATAAQMSKASLNARASGPAPEVEESSPSRDTPTQPPSEAHLPERTRLAAGWKASWSPDGTRLVYGKPNTGGLQILDVESGQVTDLTTSGRDPAWSPDGRLIAYVEKPDANDASTVQVWLITPAGSAHRKLTDGGYPTWSKDGKTLFVPSRKENKIFSFDVDNPDVGPRVFYDGPQSWYTAVSSDGKRIAFGRRDELVIMDRETGQVVLTWPTPGRPGLLPGWSPDGRQVAFGGYNKNQLGLWVLDVQAQEAVQVAAGAFTMPAWSNDGTKLAFDLRSESETEIWVVQTKDIQGPKVNAARAAELAKASLNTRASRPAPGVEESSLLRDTPTQPPSVAHLPERTRLVAAGMKASWSPDGTRIAFNRPQGKGLQILDLANGQTTDLTDSGRDPVWSPDDRFIAYVDRANSDVNQPEEVWLITPAGYAPRKLSEGGYPTWFADGKTLIVHSRKQNRVLALAVDKPDSEPEVFFGRPQSWYPAVSPDGKLIAFGRRDELAIMDRESGQLVLVWPVPGRRGLLPAWSPDGRQIAYGGFNNDLFGVWVLDIAAQEAVQVATGPFTMPAWSNDGTKLAFDQRGTDTREVWMIQTKDIQGTRVNASKAAQLSKSVLDPRVSQPRPSIVSPGGPLFIGKPAPTFSLQDIDGRQVNLADFKGKVVLLDFWATWCPPCVKAIPHLEALHQKYEKKDLVVLGLNDERDHAKVKEFAKNMISYVVLLDAKTQFAQYDVRGIPALFYIDRDGTVRYQESGFAEGKEKEIESQIKGLLVSNPRDGSGPGQEPRGLAQTGSSQASGSNVVAKQSTPGLIAWRRFDETEGRVAADSSGRGNHGTLVGDPQRQQDRIGGALAFDGVDGYVVIKNTPDFDITKEITVACWIKIAKFDKPWQAIIAKGNLAWRIIRATDGSTIEFACTGVHVPNSQWGNVYGKTAVDDGKWHHLAGVYDGTHVCLYVDGVLDASVEGTGTLNANDDDVLIGANAGDAWRYWHGLIDDVRVYNCALSEEEVKALHAGKGLGPVAMPAPLEDE